MTYQELLATRAARIAADAARKAEWLAGADLDQMETDNAELEQFKALAE